MNLIARHLLLAAVVLIYGVIFFTSERPWSAINRPGIDDVGPPRIALGGADPATRVGYSYREFSIMKLPLLGYPDAGPVLFLDTVRGREQVPVTRPDGMLSMLREDYAPFTEGAYFPVWRHVWGWLLVIAGIGIGLSYLGAAKRKREALDLI